MRNFLLAVAVWGVLYGVAEILGVMPRVELPRGETEEVSPAGASAPADGAAESIPDAGASSDAGVRPDSAPDSAPDAVPPDASEALHEAAEADAETDADGEAAPAPPETAPETAPGTNDVDAKHADEPAAAEAPLCGASEARPRLHLARLPNGRGALLVDCGRHAELVVPEPSTGEAVVVARFSFSAPLTKVEAVELTGDDRHDLAFAFADRVVLLPSTPFGLWAEPKTLEGWTGGAAPARGARKKVDPVSIGEEPYSVVARGEGFVLESGPGVPLRLSPAPLVFEAELR